MRTTRSPEPSASVSLPGERRVVDAGVTLGQEPAVEVGPVDPDVREQATVVAAAVRSGVEHDRHLAVGHPLADGRGCVLAGGAETRPSGLGVGYAFELGGVVFGVDLGGVDAEQPDPVGRPVGVTDIERVAVDHRDDGHLVGRPAGRRPRLRGSGARAPVGAAGRHLGSEAGTPRQGHQEREGEERARSVHAGHRASKPTGLAVSTAGLEKGDAVGCQSSPGFAPPGEPPVRSCNRSHERANLAYSSTRSPRSAAS